MSDDIEELTFGVIGHIRSDFPEKFGIPRQSGRVPELLSTVVLEGEYKNPDALRGLEGFSHLWVLWIFSEASRAGWSPTVRPPRLGGNRRMGVFATRSPYRPNPIAMSAVKIEHIDAEKGEITVSGGDMMDGTPIVDIKPYLPSADKIDGAVGGFADEQNSHRLNVTFDCEFSTTLDDRARAAIVGILADDPRPSYQNDPTRVYGMDYAEYSVKFRVAGDDLTVVEIKNR